MSPIVLEKRFKSKALVEKSRKVLAKASEKKIEASKKRSRRIIQEYMKKVCSSPMDRHNGMKENRNTQPIEKSVKHVDLSVQVPKSNASKRKSFDTSSPIQTQQRLTEKSANKSRRSKDKITLGDMENLSAEFAGELDMDVSYEELLLKYEAILSELEKLEHEEVCKKNIQDNLVESNNANICDAVISLETENITNCDLLLDIPLPDPIIPASAQILEENDDDSELAELRNQALASRALKRLSIPKKMNNNNVAVSTVSGILSSSTSYQEMLSSRSSAYSIANLMDNYEVADMDEGTETDEDTGNVIQTSKGPSMEVEQDPDLDLLREKLLASFRAKKPKIDNQAKGISIMNTEVISPLAFSDNSSNANTNTIPVLTSIITSIPSGNNAAEKEKASAKKKKVVSTSLITIQTRKRPNKKPFVMPYQKQAPVVIALGVDSTDSESESDTEIRNRNKQAAMASLAKLIDSVKEDTTIQERPESEPERLHSVPTVISRLPTIQQEEYNKLKQILAQKEPPKSPENNVLKTYDLLMNKLKVAQNMVEGGKKLMLVSEKRSNERKMAFVKSQVKVRQLQEQLEAAMKIKEINKKWMFEANAQLDKYRTSVKKQLLFIAELKKQCSKIQKSIVS